MRLEEAAMWAAKAIAKGEEIEPMIVAPFIPQPVYQPTINPLNPSDTGTQPFKIPFYHDTIPVGTVTCGPANIK